MEFAKSSGLSNILGSFPLCGRMADNNSFIQADSKFRMQIEEEEEEEEEEEDKDEDEEEEEGGRGGGED